MNEPADAGLSGVAGSGATGSVVAGSVVDAYIGAVAPNPAGRVATGPGLSRFDEMIDADQVIRPAWSEVAAGMTHLGDAGLQRIRGQVQQMLDNDGVTYIPVDQAHTAPRPGGGDAGPAADDAAGAGNAAGADDAAGAGDAGGDADADSVGATAISDTDDLSPGRERWKLDPVPLVLDAAEWHTLEAALRQRATLLDLILTDIYGPRTLLRRGYLPADLIFTNRAYLRPAHGVTIPGAHQLFFYAADVFRTTDGNFLALGDRTEAPSGAGYAMADRRVIARVAPDTFRRTAPHSLTPFFRSLLLAMQSVAPRAADQPRVVVLSPGARSETAFDQAFVAGLLGLPLVENEDLTVREGRVWMRALGRYEPVDVILRRVDSDYADPLDLRPNSQLGVVGLLQACRRGSVSVVNTLGSGILESPGLLPFLPALSEVLLDEPLKLPSVSTFWCGDPTSRSHVLTHFADMVMRPTDGEQRSVIVARLNAARTAALRDRVVAEPHRWVGQPFAPFSVAPCGTEEGLQPRQVGIRLFAVAHEAGYVVMPGGLGRALPLDQQTHRMSGLTEAKDVWINSGAAALAGDRESTPWATENSAGVGRANAMSSPRALEDLFWFGRYTERTEDFARLLIATWDRLDEFRERGTELGAELTPLLLAAVTHSSATYPGFVFGRSDILTEMRSVVLDSSRRGSVAQSLFGLTEAASAVRDQLSRDTWLVLAGVERALAELERDVQDRGTALQIAHSAVLSGMLALGGLAAENMTRDFGWYLMDIGRRLERALQLVTVLRWALGRAHSPSVEVQLIESVLQFAESILTYRRRYRGRTQVGTVLELLLLDAGNPRSLAYQLEALNADFRALPDASGTSLPERLLEELTARVRRCDVAALDAADETGERADLIEFLTGTRSALSALADAVAAQRFRHQAQMQQLGRPISARAAADRRPA